MLAVIAQGPYGFEHVNAAKQRDPNSMMNWIERIVRMRKEVPEIGWGDFKVIATRDPAVPAIRYDWRNNSAPFVHNLDGARGLVFGWPPGADQTSGQPAGGGPQPAWHGRITAARGLRLPRMRRVEHLLKRSDIDVDAVGRPGIRRE